ncbi:caffeine-induced death protein 2 [Radiomyces spectabilis]|uniref:caffeine-induced death protein 2 n=1 Tax=Radiomyces spectabilis TaxID=64574 RepID=UPI00222123F1|nr:caffeine-induced death protein 2 [Radiomyces spectabilis]KAI8388457.1 caffeine-induced death protein 2 [Radiomyces spectabilis]
MSEKELSPSTCFNFSFFKDYMRELRKVDDTITLRLNSTDTTSEQACAQFFKDLADAYTKREHAVNYCLKIMDEQIDAKYKKLSEDPDDFDTQNSVFADETKRRQVANERMVEEIVRDRTLQVFKSKCRVFDTATLSLKS